MRKSFSRLFLFLCALSLIRCEYASGWSGSGHMIVAEIAYEQLHPQSKSKCDELIGILAPFYPESDTFVKASTWLDTINFHDFRMLWKWHFTNIPYDPFGILTESDRELIKSVNAGSDILYGLEHAITTLKSPKANPFEKAFMLRYLIHAVADVHQPLHTTSFYHPSFPKGDEGGNLFSVDSPLAKKLHFLWDMGLGALPQIEQDPSEEVLDELHLFAHALISCHPKENFADSMHASKELWVQESHALAKSAAYTLEPGTRPSEEYLEQGREVSKRQLALAGYRLGALLNQLFESKP